MKKILDKLNLILDDKKSVKIKIVNMLFDCPQPLTIDEAKFYLPKIFKNKKFENYLNSFKKIDEKNLKFYIASWINHNFFEGYLNEENEEYITKEKLGWDVFSSQQLKKIILKVLKS